MGANPLDDFASKKILCVFQDALSKHVDMPAMTDLLKPFVTRSRLRCFGETSARSLPVANLRFRSACDATICARFVSANSHFASGFKCVDDNRLTGWIKRTVAITNFDHYSDFEAYRRAVSKETKGKYHRSADKARREGFASRQIAVGAYQRSLFELMTSKEYRSRGEVTLGRAITRPAQDDAPSLTLPDCPEHWRIDWGVFRKGSPRMWAFASLIRTGNLVHLAHMAAHADVLKTGVMKLLQFDIMRWLLTREDLFVRNVSYLAHGAIEDGGIGAMDWRRYVQQHPHLIHMEKIEQAAVPADFDPAAYLALNPDVAAAGANPARHYLQHGMLEGRSYKRPI